MNAWKRTPKDDPFYAGSLETANHLREISQQEVIFGFNELYAPSLDEAFDQAMNSKLVKIVVVTPMMTRGGEHSDLDIPAMIKRAEARYPDAAIDYIWPVDPSQVAGFLAEQNAQFDSDRSPST